MTISQIQRGAVARRAQDAEVAALEAMASLKAHPPVLATVAACENAANRAASAASAAHKLGAWGAAQSAFAVACKVGEAASQARDNLPEG